MNPSVQSLCESLAAGRSLLKNTFRLENDMLYPVCANLFCVRGVTPDAARLLACRDLIRANTGFFSCFRGNARLPLICLLSLEKDPDERLQRVITAYELLKKRFFSSDFLALAAYFISDMDEEGTAGAAERARGLYERMRKEHPLLTGSEDSVFCVLLARMDRDDSLLIADMEESYALLKDHFRDSNSMQTVSHSLATDPRTPKEKVGRLTDLYEELVRRGIRYGRWRELSVLSSLALADGSIPSLADELCDADEALSREKGWQGILGFNRRTRAMHAAMLSADLHAPTNPNEQTSVTGALAGVIAEEMAVFAAVTAASAAAAASSNT